MTFQNRRHVRNNGSLWQLLFFLFASVLILVVGFFAYLYLFTNQFPFSEPYAASWKLDPNGQYIDNGDTSWMVSYEFSGESTYDALVRHASRIHMDRFPMLSHDILVTTGDYADPNVVNAGVDVFAHHFSWQARVNRPLEGYIHLLHTVPANEEMYQKLLQIQSGDHVKIKGREIYKINAFELATGRDLGYWIDTGCNTLLVTSVER